MGIGTDIPNNPLHIVTDASGVNFKLENQTSRPRMAFVSSKHQWNMGVENNADFAIRDYDNTTNVLVIQDGSPFNITHGSGAGLTSGSWIAGSSREYKDNIYYLSTEEAMGTLEKLDPVKFIRKEDPKKEQHVGFIAEDVPELVATADRKGLASMDIVAVLTKVAQ